MKNRQLKKIIYTMITLVLLQATTQICKAQDNNMLYNMSNMPQAYQLNPGLIRDSSKITLTIPALARYSIGLTSSFSISEVAYKEGSDLVIDLDKLYNNLSETNSIYQFLRTPLISFQLRSNNRLYSFSVHERQLFKFQFEKNLIGFMRDGNSAYVGQTFSTNFDINLLHYREYALGYSQNIIDNLMVGGRVKLLSGMAIINTLKSNLSITTDADLEYLNLTTDGEYKTSLPVNTTKDASGIVSTIGFDTNFDPMKYVTNFANLGIGFDLGASYLITPQIEVSASVIDLGVIKWKSNLNNLVNQGTFTWKGLDFSNSIDQDDPDYVPFDEKMSSLSDSLSSIMEFNEYETPFSTNLPTRIYLGGKYQINNMLSAGIVDRVLFYDNKVSNAFTISGNAMFGKIMSLSASYSVIQNSFNNLGLGASFKFGPVQFFVITDNILAITNVLTTQHMNASFGFNFMFGHK